MWSDNDTGFKLCVNKLTSANPGQLRHMRRTTTAYKQRIVTLPDPDLLLTLSQGDRRVHISFSAHKRTFIILRSPQINSDPLRSTTRTIVMVRVDLLLAVTLFVIQAGEQLGTCCQV